MLTARISGDINAVLVTIVFTHDDISLVSSVQSLCLFTMVLVAPLLIRLVGCSRLC
ncbi:hypothetical protein ACFVT2_26825 [Streptomyces sp. NPDC058000]|uniref:hypothetical protein n=1 Tax=Streptomyces sp. NPDC058000 TaxID=3346299 RepID=UPI0036E7900B